MMIHLYVRISGLIRVPQTANAIPSSAKITPRRAVSGEVRPRSRGTNRTDATR
jgi:hypothetical protein